MFNYTSSKGSQLNLTAQALIFARYLQVLQVLEGLLAQFKLVKRNTKFPALHAAFLLDSILILVVFNNTRLTKESSALSALNSCVINKRYHIAAVTSY